jgi:hypothetical protein
MRQAMLELQGRGLTQEQEQFEAEQAQQAQQAELERQARMARTQAEVAGRVTAAGQAADTRRDVEGERRQREEREAVLANIGNQQIGASRAGLPVQSFDEIKIANAAEIGRLGITDSEIEAALRDAQTQANEDLIENLYLQSMLVPESGEFEGGIQGVDISGSLPGFELPQQPVTFDQLDEDQLEQAAALMAQYLADGMEEEAAKALALQTVLAGAAMPLADTAQIIGTKLKPEQEPVGGAAFRTLLGG